MSEWEEREASQEVGVRGAPGEASPRPADGRGASVVVVDYNAGAERARRVAAALRAQRLPPAEVLVVDNASRDASAEAFAEAGRGLPLRVLRPGRNLGFAAANNLAVRAARSPLVALLNPDAYPAPGWLEALVAAAERYPWAAAFGSLQVDAFDPARLDGAGDVYTAWGYAYRGHWRWPTRTAPRRDAEVFAPCAAAALYRRDAFLEVGGFDERFFCYHEDVDLGFRLRLAGWRSVQVAAARVLHEGSGVTGFRSDFVVYHGTRNRIWTYVKNMPAGVLCATLPAHVLLNGLLQIRGWRNGTLRAVLRGQRDALRGLPGVLASRSQVARRAKVREVLGAMTWSPSKPLRRAADLRSLEAAAPRGPEVPSPRATASAGPSRESAP